jgi:hypothetical protein
MVAAGARLRMKSLLLLSVLLCVCAVGCNAPPRPRVDVAPQSVPFGALAVRNNSYSLLYDLMGDERHVSKVLMVKRDSRELSRLIKDISETSSAAAKSLEEFSKRDSSLALDVLNLPPGEVATRAAIADTKKKELLGTSGADFERALVLTQISALNYGVHLARVAAVNDASSERAAWLHDLGQRLHVYQKRCLALLREPSMPTAAHHSNSQ